MKILTQNSKTSNRNQKTRGRSKDVAASRLSTSLRRKNVVRKDSILMVAGRFIRNWEGVGVQIKARKKPRRHWLLIITFLRLCTIRSNLLEKKIHEMNVQEDTRIIKMLCFKSRGTPSLYFSKSAGIRYPRKTGWSTLPACYRTS